jgi:hypothetical protein
MNPDEIGSKLVDPGDPLEHSQQVRAFILNRRSLAIQYR